MSRGSAHRLTTPPPADWRESAACAGLNDDTFFPLGNGPEAQAQTRHAKATCFGCPVQPACGQWAIDNRIGSGVWGGVDEKERRAILRRRGVRLPADPDTDTEAAA